MLHKSRQFERNGSLRKEKKTTKISRKTTGRCSVVTSVYCVDTHARPRDSMVLSVEPGRQTWMVHVARHRRRHSTTSHNGSAALAAGRSSEYRPSPRNTGGATNTETMSFVAVLALAAIFVFVTTAIVAAIVAVCRKRRNSVHALQRSELDDYSSEDEEEAYELDRLTDSEMDMNWTYGISHYPEEEVTPQSMRKNVTRCDDVTSTYSNDSSRVTGVLVTGSSMTTLTTMTTTTTCASQLPTNLPLRTYDQQDWSVNKGQWPNEHTDCWSTQNSTSDCTSNDVDSRELNVVQNMTNEHEIILEESADNVNCRTENADN